MTQQEQGQKMGQIIAKAWADEVFKQRLLADATAVLKEEGVTVPEGVTVKAVENSEKVFHLVLSPKQAGGELSEAALCDVSGGRDPKTQYIFRLPKESFGDGGAGG